MKTKAQWQRHIVMRVCPRCEQRIEQFGQDGPDVVAKPCGHVLGTGSAAEVTAWIRSVDGRDVPLDPVDKQAVGGE